MFDFESKNIIDNINFFSISTWVEVEFLPEDSAYIVGKIGGWSFYKDYDQNGLDKLEFLEFLEKSFQGKKDQHIHDQVLEKLKTIAPKEFCCNAEIYATESLNAQKVLLSAILRSVNILMRLAGNYPTTILRKMVLFS